jgi:predicted dehydrogenase
MSALRIGLIGLGQMGQSHLRILAMLRSVELTFVFDLDPARGAKATADYGVLAVADPFAALDTVDAVVICTPTSTHADYVRRAAEKVRNIFVEKPLGSTLEEAEQLRDLAAERGLFLQVGFIERFNPATQQLKRILDASDQVICVDFTRTNRLSSRITDVDVVTDLMIHDLDLAMFLNGPVTSVSAHGSVNDGMVELASAVLSHQDGRFSRVLASRITEKKLRTVQATCSDAYVDCDLLRKEIIINRQSQVREPEGEPYVITALEEAVQVRPQEALLSEIQAFVAAAVSGDHSQVPTAVDGLAAQQICEQIRTELLK